MRKTYIGKETLIYNKKKKKTNLEISMNKTTISMIFLPFNPSNPLLYRIKYFPQQA